MIKNGALQNLPTIFLSGVETAHFRLSTRIWTHLFRTQSTPRIIRMVALRRPQDTLANKSSMCMMPAAIVPGLPGMYGALRLLIKLPLQYHVYSKHVHSYSQLTSYTSSYHFVCRFAPTMRVSAEHFLIFVLC